MPSSRKAAVLAAVIAYIRSCTSRPAARARPKPVSAWKLSRALDADDPTAAEVEA